MTAPLLDAAPGVLAIPIGIAFGATLERAGLGSARTIADQLTGRDFTVVKVMLSAIVTAMLGIFWADHLGWLDLARVAVPITDILPQLIGAVLFGAGFALASLCPGTACVSAATGGRDGLLTIGGLFVGTLVTMELWPQLGRIAEFAPSDARLPASIGLSSGVVVGGIAILGVAGLWLLTRNSLNPPAKSHHPIAIAAIVLGCLSLLTGRNVLASPSAMAGLATEIAKETDHVDALDLAQWIKDRKPGLRVIDVREDLAPDDYRIPGAEAVPIGRIPGLAVHDGETLVIYSDGGGHAAQAWVMVRLRGITGAYVLRDGLEAWEDEIMSPRIPAAGDSAGIALFTREKALAAWFGGLPSTEPRGPAVSSGSSVTDSSRSVKRGRRKSC